MDHKTYEFLLRKSQIGLWEWADMEKDEQVWSPMMYEIIGRDPSTFKPTAKNILSILHPEDKEAFNVFLNRKLESLDEISIEIRIQLENKRYQWINFSSYKKSSEKNSHLVGSIKSIDKRKNIQNELEQTLDFLSSAEELSNIGSYKWKLNDDTLWLSKGSRKIYGIGEDVDFTFKNLFEIMHPEDKDRVFELVSNHSDTILKEPLDYRVIVNGEIKYCIAESFYFKKDIEAEGYFMGIIKDNTHNELKNQKMNSLISDLQRSNQELEQFAYVASHDLQEPLRKIQTFGQRLVEKSRDLPEKQVMYVDRMQNAANRMQKLIQDLLDYSRASRVKEMGEYLDLNSVFNNILDDIENRIKESEAEINIQDLPKIYGNDGQIYRLFLNLLSNALKFSKEDVVPNIQINYSIKKRKDLKEFGFQNVIYSKYHCVEIQDNGIGFDEEYLDKVFTIFQRLHGRNEYEGTGIGLAICEKIVVNHGGFITAKSTLGKGASFLVFLPSHSKKIKL